MTNNNYIIEDNENTYNQDDEKTLITKYKFNCKTVSYTLDFLVNLISRKKFIIDPDFQRLPEAWSLLRKQSLILSFYQGIPIPPIYVFEIPSEDNQQIYNVIDGVQRITAIESFLKEEFSITIDGEEKKINDLKGFGDKVIDVVLIDQISPDDKINGQYEIFKILNQSPVVLTKQEIRNCTHRGRFNDFIRNDLNKNILWREIWGRDENSSRFQDIEMILRCLIIAFYFEEFKSSMSETINGFMEHYNRKFDNSKNEIDNFKKFFIETCKIFVDNNIEIDSKKNTRFESIFGSIIKGIKNNKKFKQNYINEINSLIKNENSEFNKITGAGGTGSKSSVEKRVEFVSKVIFEENI